MTNQPVASGSLISSSSATLTADAIAHTSTIPSPRTFNVALTGLHNDSKISTEVTVREGERLPRLVRLPPVQSPVLAALICPLLLLVLAAFVSPSLRGVVVSFGVSEVFCVVLCGGACYNKLQKQAPRWCLF